MRLTGTLTAFLAVVAALIWTGCDETSQLEQLQGPDPSFKQTTGAPPEDCDVKGLPVKDYFTNRDTIKSLTAELRDLSRACADGATTDVAGFARPDAYGIGFSILKSVAANRPPAAADLAVYAAGGLIVEGVWKAMRYNGPACSDCADPVPYVDSTAAALALQPGGALDVRDASSGDDPVYSMDVLAGTEGWGIEPPPGSSWVDVLPARVALVYGHPGSDGGLTGEDELLGAEGGYSWYVLPWYDAPDGTVAPLLVGTCAASTGGNAALISHLASFLPQGEPPSYCPLPVTASFRQRVTRLASLLVPFWPSHLNASLLVGASGSGKAREFSPFNGYDVAPVANYAIGVPEPVTHLGEDGGTICFDYDGTDPDPRQDGCAFFFDWTTEYGNPIATEERLLISAVDNNAAKTKLTFSPPPNGRAVCILGGDPGAEDYDTNEILCTCDGRETAAAPCDRVELPDLTLSKTGVFEICVRGVGGPESSGLIIEGCTGDFHMKP
jgi:hypothetical protein